MISSLGLKTFSGDEMVALTQASTCLWWVAFFELASVGLRTGEILRLHHSDLDERTLSVRVTSDPTETCGDGEHVSLRCCLAPHRERVLSISSNAMRTLSCFRSERPSDSYLFVPDAELVQLWVRITGEGTLRSEDLCPSLGACFQMLQRRARLVLAKNQGVPVSQIKWPRRPLAAIRTTAIHRMAKQQQPSQLAELLGYASVGPVLRFYDAASSGPTGVVA